MREASYNKQAFEKPQLCNRVIFEGSVNINSVWFHFNSSMTSAPQGLAGQVGNRSPNLMANCWTVKLQFCRGEVHFFSMFLVAR